MGFFDDKAAGQYTLGDLVFWSGVIAGLIGSYYVLEAWELMPVLRLVIGALVGAGLGWMLERGYEYLRRRPPDERQANPP